MTKTVITSLEINELFAEGLTWLLLRDQLVVLSSVGVSGTVAIYEFIGLVGSLSS